MCVCERERERERRSTHSPILYSFISPRNNKIASYMCFCRNVTFRIDDQRWPYARINRAVQGRKRCQLQTITHIKVHHTSHYTPHFTLHTTGHTTHHTLHTAHHTVHSTHYTVHSTLYIVHNTLCIVHTHVTYRSWMRFLASWQEALPMRSTKQICSPRAIILMRGI